MREAQRILITGASSGIGRALALGYAAPRRSLLLLGRDAARLELVVQECRAKGAAVETSIVDVRDRLAMAACVEQAGERQSIDLLIANAGVATGLSPGQFVEDPQAVRGAFAINVLGVFNTVEPAIAPMCQRKNGHIAVVGSMAGLRGLPHSPAYCATKAAVHLYADSLRGALARHGVNVSLIVPGFVKTPMNAKLNGWQPGALSDEQAARIIKRGLERGAAVIAFPLFVYYAMRLFTVLPPRIVDSVMARFHYELAQTTEREEP
ncbi:MAG: SDR family NAD(P)-dependent oxidoreductase [Methylocystis sp.]|nr:SDR family NAD(P)-dependent oxidoreductase [Methylocystis sp.]